VKNTRCSAKAILMDMFLSRRVAGVRASDVYLPLFTTSSQSLLSAWFRRYQPSQ
jgi:hypothetical protein